MRLVRPRLVNYQCRRQEPNSWLGLQAEAESHVVPPARRRRRRSGQRGRSAQRLIHDSLANSNLADPSQSGWRRLRPTSRQPCRSTGTADIEEASLAKTRRRAGRERRRFRIGIERICLESVERAVTTDRQPKVNAAGARIPGRSPIGDWCSRTTRRRASRRLAIGGCQSTTSGSSPRMFRLMGERPRSSIA